MLDQANRTFICSVVFIAIISASRTGTLAPAIASPMVMTDRATFGPSSLNLAPVGSVRCSAMKVNVDASRHDDKARCVDVPTSLIELTPRNQLVD